MFIFVRDGPAGRGKNVIRFGWKKIEGEKLHWNGSDGVVVFN